MANHFTKAVGKASFRTFCLTNIIVTYYTIAYVIKEWRHGWADPVDYVIAGEVFFIWLTVELMFVAADVLWRQRRRAHR